MTGKRSSVKNNSDPVYLQTYKKILEDIRTCVLLPGKKLPADMEFAKQLGINHLTLKKALNRLAAEGFLIRTRGRGTFIAENPPPIRLTMGKRVALIYDMVHEESFHGDIFLSIYKAVGELGLTLELISSNNSRTDQFQQIISLFSDPDSAGCIVWPIMDMRQLENLAVAKPDNYPLVFINHKPELDIGGIDFSGYDDYGSGRKLGEHIAALGFRKCVVCQARTFRKKSSNINRIAGLQTGLGFSPEIFSGYECATIRNDLSPAPFMQTKLSSEKTAIVFISDTDYSSVKDILPQTSLTPFIFFTGIKPCTNGIHLPARQMGENAIRILAERRNGNNNFSISHRITGTIV